MTAEQLCAALRKVDVGALVFHFDGSYGVGDVDDISVCWQDDLDPAEDGSDWDLESSCAQATWPNKHVRQAVCDSDLECLCLEVLDKCCPDWCDGQGVRGYGLLDLRNGRGYVDGQRRCLVREDTQVLPSPVASFEQVLKDLLT